MQPDQINQITTQFVAQGISGSLAVILFWVAFYFYRVREADRTKYETMIAAKDALIMQLYEKRVDDGKTLHSVMASNDKAMEAFARTVNARPPL